MKTLVAGYYTTDGYEAEAEALAVTCRDFGVEYVLGEYPPFESWNHAVAHKPAFLLSLFNSFREVDGFLYVDADARFRQKPDLAFLENVGFAAHEWTRTVHHETEILTGTMWFLNTPPVREFVADWAEATPRFRHMDCPEQQSLRAILPNWKPKIVTAILPPEWCWIEPDFEAHYPQHGPVVIAQTQASRRLRGKAGARKA